MTFQDRPLIFVDVETSGLSPLEGHEILDIAALVVNPYTHQIERSWATRVRPTRLHLASPKALEINGYNERDWENATTLKRAMEEFSWISSHGILTGWNISFDKKFIDSALHETGVKLNDVDYHSLDIPSMCYFMYGKLPSLKMDEVAKYIGIKPEDEIHRAKAGAEMALRIYQYINATLERWLEAG